MRNDAVPDARVSATIRTRAPRQQRRRGRRSYPACRALHPPGGELRGDVRGPRQDAAYCTLLTELDNIRAAFDWHLAAGGAVTALRLVRILRTFWTDSCLPRVCARARSSDPWRQRLRGGTAGGPADAALIGYVTGREDCARHAEESVAVSHAAGIPPTPRRCALLPSVTFSAVASSAC